MVARFPSFGGIKAFYALVETCRLAWGLCFSLSHQIKKLEQELNIRLLESNAGKLRPTDAGFRYFLGAERLCRTADQIDPARVFGSRHCFGRGTSAPNSEILRSLLQWRQNTSVSKQSYAGFSAGSAIRSHKFARSILGGLHHHYLRV